MVEETQYLKHAGVKGMKWGVRKDSSGGSSKGGSKSSTSAKKSKSSSSSDLKVEVNKKPKIEDIQNGGKKLNKKHYKEMSNKELIEATERLNLEKRFLEVSKSMTPPKKKTAAQKGKEILDKILWDVGEDLGKQSLYYAAAKLINSSNNIKVSQTKYSNPKK